MEGRRYFTISFLTKIEELYGKELKLDQTLRGRDISANELAMAAMASDNQVVKLAENDVKNDLSIETFMYPS